MKTQKVLVQKVLPLTILLSTSLVLSGCDSETPSPQGSTATSVAPKPSKPRPSDAQIAKLIKKDLDKSFGFKGTEPEWYLSIKRIEVHGNTVKVHTDLLKNAMFNEFIAGACGGVSTFVYSSANSHLGLTSVEVYGKDGNVLVWRHRISDSCQP